MKKLKKIIKKINITYSPKKIRRKDNRESSVLKPETSSLSPSIRSKGTREASQSIHKKKMMSIIIK